MNELLTLALVASLAGAVGAAAGVLLMAHFASTERQRWDARVGPVESGLEDLREEWLKWQRRRNKRERDAAAPSGDGQGELPVMDPKRAILMRARALGIGRGAV